MKTRHVLPIMFLLFSVPGFAQNDVDNFIDDMLLIADEFATPAAEGASYMSGAGWFYSAKNLEVWDFEVSVLGNILIVPDNKKITSISSANYQTLDIRDAETANIPTAFGGLTDVVFEGEILGNQFEFDAIDGVNKNFLAHPFVQASVGLPYGTDLTVRFLPETTIDDVAFSTYGVGIKHNFNQYFFNSQPNDFQFAAMVAYSKYDVHYEFVPLLIEYELLNEQRVALELDQIEVDANIFLFQLLTSKSFFDSGWEAFGSLGVSTSAFGYVAGGSGDFINLMNSALETLEENNFEFKADVGLSYQVGNFRLSSMITAGKFFNVNLGLHYKI